MSDHPGHSELEEVADRLRLGIGLVVRRIRQLHEQADLTLPESAALGRLERGGPATSSDLARQEQISPQSMGATLAALEGRGYWSAQRRPGRRPPRRAHPHRGGLPRCATAAAPAPSGSPRRLADRFTPEEVATLRAAAPLLERLAERL